MLVVTDERRAETLLVTHGSQTMKHGPDMNRIGWTVAAWQKGVMTFDEAKERLVRLMDTSNYLPQVEQLPEPVYSVASQMSLSLLQRIEQKLNIIIQHAGISLPDELNAKVLAEDVKDLAFQNRIEATQIHRERTGAGLAEAKMLIDEYLRQCG
jgi:hypothetical protein